MRLLVPVLLGFSKFAVLRQLKQSQHELIRCFWLFLFCLTKQVPFKGNVNLMCKIISSSDLVAFAYSESYSGTGPGSVRASKISCPAQWRSSAFLCESFLTPLASRKNSKEGFQRRHLRPTLVGLPLQSSGLIFPNSMFTPIFGTFPLGDYWRLVFVLVASFITLLFPLKVDFSVFTHVF